MLCILFVRPFSWQTFWHVLSGEADNHYIWFAAVGRGAVVNVFSCTFAFPGMTWKMSKKQKGLYTLTCFFLKGHHATFFTPRFLNCRTSGGRMALSWSHPNKIKNTQSFPQMFTHINVDIWLESRKKSCIVHL